jgi:hypothetical protein
MNQRMTGPLPGGTLDMVGLWVIDQQMVMGTAAGMMLTLPIEEGIWLEQQRAEYAFQSMLRNSYMRQDRRRDRERPLAVYVQNEPWAGLEAAPFFVLETEPQNLASLAEEPPPTVPVKRAEIWVRPDVLVIANRPYQVWWGFDAAVRAWVVRDPVYRMGVLDRPVGYSVAGMARKGQR